MKVLLDTCISGKVRSELEASGHDADWSGAWPEDPGDEEILARAYAEDRVLITLDKDFGELAIVYGKPHCGIVRLVDIASWQQGAVCNQLLRDHGEELISGAILTVEPGRLRIRPPDAD